MSNLFQDNAYHVLGLDTSASQKDITKRSKEIVNLLRIEEEPSYETDLNIISLNRKENTVKEAVQRLSSPTKRIKEYFFWFDIETDTDEKAVKLLKEQKIDEAISVWEAPAKNDTANGFVAKKNLAVLASVLLLKTGQKKYLTQSIGYWKDILLSEKFWPHFEKLYALNDEIGTSKAALDDFAKQATDHLSDFYTDISEVHKDRGYYSLFSQVFAVKGQRMQENVLSPIYEAIHEASERLRSLNISEDNIISDDEIKTVRQLLRKLQDNFGKLKELGLYSDSQSKTMRDKAAEAIRTVALDIYNNLYESAKPAALLEAASKIAGTPGTKQKLDRDIQVIKKNIANEKIIIPINDLLEKDKFTEALDLIEKQMPKHADDKELTQYFRTRVAWCVTGIATKDFKECMAQFNNKRFEEAERNFLGLRDFILSYIGYFDIDKASIDGVLNRIDQLTATGSVNIDNIQAYRNKIINEAPESFKEQFEEMILIVLVDSSIYGNLANKLPAIRRKNTLKKWAWWIVIGIIFLIISASSSSDDSSTGTGTSTGGSSSSGSSSNSEWQACSDEYDSLKSQLDSVEASMRRYEAYDDADSYNDLVPRQNSLVQQVNAKAAECNNLR